MRPQFELRQSADGKTWRLTGYASRTGVPYPVNDARGSYTETVRSGAFASTLTAGADVVLATEHAPPFVARTPNTLTLVEDGNGLKVDAELDASDPDVQALASKVRRGILPEMSFSFRVPSHGDEWNSDRSRRTILTADIDGGDVSVVRSGANSSTSVNVRGRAAGEFEVRTAAGGIAVVERRQQATSGRTRPSTVLDLTLRASRAQFKALEAEVTQLARQHRGGTARDRQEFVWRASRAAQEARARGDWEMAATWHRIQEQEIQAALVGL